MDPRTVPSDIEHPEIPHLNTIGRGIISLAYEAPGSFQAVLNAGRQHYGQTAMAIGNAFSKRWLTRNGNPYLYEINELAVLANGPGVHLLNMSYEWSCTTSVAPDPAGEGSRLLRTLDWPLDGLGRNVVVARMAGPAGEYENVTWPGFTGIATAMAPGRFAAAINQPPMRKWTQSYHLDWFINRQHLWRSRALPPVHLMRRVFDNCRNYADAKEALIRTPLSMPAFFTLVGNDADEGCVIERTETNSVVRKSPASVSNHWVGDTRYGYHRGIDSESRYAQMEAILEESLHDKPFQWVMPPILNATTRLAVIATPKSGRLVVQGWEREEPVVKLFDLGG